MSPALDYFSNATYTLGGPRCIVDGGLASPCSSSDVYYNPRLDPVNFLEGPLSPNPATRLRQMLARPGIVVSVVSI
jgi:hypothetical protein